MGKMILPNFLIIGAAKAGTTALYEMLKKHPDVYMSSIKEPNYFVLKRGDFVYKKDTITESYRKTFVTDYHDYVSLFIDGKNYKARGEASPIYLYDRNAAEEIKKAIPNVKLIVILRNPIERAFSNFSMHLAGTGLETTKNFITALKLEEKRKKENWWWGFYYKDAGLYYQQLVRYYELFDKNQILVLFHEDLKNKPKETFLKITNFLDIKPLLVDNLEKKYKVTYIPKYRFIESILVNEHLSKLGKKLHLKDTLKPIREKVKNRNKKIPKMNEKEFYYLAPFFEKDIKKLEQLLNVNLDHWFLYKQK